MPDIIILPRRSGGGLPTIQFSGSASSSINLEVLPEGQVSFSGKSGSLFSITDSLEGSLMAVGDSSGLPILEVFSDDRVIMGQFNKNTLVVSASSVGVGKIPSQSFKLDVSGSVSVGNITGTITTSANTINGSGGAFATLLALPTGWGTVHVIAQETGTTNLGYYQVDFVNGTGIAIQAKTGTTAGGTTGQLTFQLSGANLQARGANATPPTVVKYWVRSFAF